MRSHRIEGSPLKYMTGICRDTLRHDSQYNLHIFLNSVEGAKALIDALELTPDIARIVCADNAENTVKLDGFPRSSTKDTVMRINLYTSTAFEGCDIYDSDGMTFIVSDTRKHDVHSKRHEETALPHRHIDLDDTDMRTGEGFKIRRDSTPV